MEESPLLASTANVVAAYQLPPHTRLAMLRVFAGIDKNYDGRISVEEIMEAFDLNRDEATKLVQQAAALHHSLSASSTTSTSNSSISNSTHNSPSSGNDGMSVDFNTFITVMMQPGRSRMSWIPVRYVRQYQEIFMQLCHRFHRTSAIYLPDLAHALNTSSENIWNENFTPATSPPPTDVQKPPEYPHHTGQAGSIDYNKILVDFDTFLEISIAPNLNVLGSHAVASVGKFDTINEEETDAKLKSDSTKLLSLDSNPASESTIELPGITRAITDHMFKLLDSDHDSLLSLEEVVVGFGCTQDEARDMIRGVDERGEGSVNSDEYASVFLDNSNSIPVKLQWVPLGVKQQCKEIAALARAPPPVSPGEASKPADPNVPFILDTSLQVVHNLASALSLSRELMDEWMRRRLHTVSEQITFGAFVLLVLELNPSLIFHDNHPHSHVTNTSGKTNASFCIACSIL
eukprot:c3353_g1_i1.p1 GENE.c3353_g1_i1~~c3353_g1_i1.p1  ORF type:complete len:461 (+),score=97.29 c3353_g1_i1:159-1541(+)